MPVELTQQVMKRGGIILDKTGDFSYPINGEQLFGVSSFQKEIKGRERKEYHLDDAKESSCHRLKAAIAGADGKCVREPPRRTGLMRRNGYSVTDSRQSRLIRVKDLRCWKFLPSVEWNRGHNRLYTDLCRDFFCAGKCLNPARTVPPDGGRYEVMGVKYRCHYVMICDI
jgi:hypothetical protein